MILQETAHLICDEAPEDSELHCAAKTFLSALTRFEKAMRGVGYERG